MTHYFPRRFHILVVVLLSFAIPAGVAVAQDDLNALKVAFDQGPDEGLLRRLIAYRDTIPDDSSFELDYMIAITLGSIPDFHDTACDYCRSLARWYEAPYVFENRQVSPNGLAQEYCAPRPQPGVRTVFKRTLPGKPSALLTNVRQQLGSRPAQPAATDGIYTMVHDGWKGELGLRGRAGFYAGSDGRRLRVRVTELSGHHIVFVITGMGGENAEGLGGQKFDGYLMTQTRDAIAGITWWQGQPFGFYAIRR